MGAFCDIYGQSIRNKVLEYLLENQKIDIAIGDMAKEIAISKPKAYDLMSDFEANDYVQKSRLVGKTQLYALNTNNQRVQLFLQHFKQCLALVAKEQENLLAQKQKRKSVRSKQRKRAVTAHSK